MKALLWLLALAALAVGLTVASRYSSGYVLVVLPPRYDPAIRLKEWTDAR